MSNPSPPVDDPQLRTAIQSLHRWTWVTALAMGIYIAAWVIFVVVQVASLVQVVADLEQRQNSADIAMPFMLGSIIMIGMMLIVIGVPAYFTMRAAQGAGRALRENGNQLVDSIIALRRFAVFCTVAIVLYFATICFVTFFRV